MKITVRRINPDWELYQASWDPYWPIGMHLAPSPRKYIYEEITLKEALKEFFGKLLKKTKKAH